MEPRDAAPVFFPDAGRVDGVMVSCFWCKPGLQVSVDRAEGIDVWAEIAYLR